MKKQAKWAVSIAPESPTVPATLGALPVVAAILFAALITFAFGATPQTLRWLGYLALHVAMYVVPLVARHHLMESDWHDAYPAEARLLEGFLIILAFAALGAAPIMAVLMIMAVR